MFLNMSRTSNVSPRASALLSLGYSTYVLMIIHYFLYVPCYHVHLYLLVMLHLQVLLEHIRYVETMLYNCNGFSTISRTSNLSTCASASVSWLCSWCPNDHMHAFSHSTFLGCCLLEGQLYHLAGWGCLSPL